MPCDAQELKHVPLFSLLDDDEAALDYDVKRRSEAEIQGLFRRLNMLDDRIADIHELLHKRGA
jgi:hypothetical protein